MAWTEEMKEAQSLRLKKAWERRNAKQRHSEVMKEHWVKRKASGVKTVQPSARERRDRNAALEQVETMKASLEKEFGMDLTLTQAATILVIHYKRKQNV